MRARLFGLSLWGRALPSATFAQSRDGQTCQRNEGRRRKLMSMRAERRDIKELSAAPTAGIIADRGNESARLVIDAADGLSRRLGASQSGAYTRAASRVRATTHPTPRPSAALRAVR